MLRKVLLSTPTGLAPGPSGLRIEHLRTIIEDRRPSIEPALLESLTLLANAAVAGRLPLSLQPFLFGGPLAPVIKKDGGIRPIVAGEILRALIAKTALAELRDGLSDLQPLQVGVGGHGLWPQAAISTVRSWVQEIRQGSTNVLVKVDVSNAFNSVHRLSCIEGIQHFAPGLTPWTKWCLSQPTSVFWDGAVIPCAAGVQRGDPCAPAFFSVAIHDVLEELLQIGPKWD